MDRLLLFDIDGTLTRTRNGFIPFNEAILKTFGICGDIRTVVPDGNTDPLIVKEICAHANLAFDFEGADWICFSANLAECYRQAVDRGATSVSALPGAAQLLEALREGNGFHSSVVTGNFEVTAAVKLGAAGLAVYLFRGAYASDSCERRALPAIAKERWERASGRSLAPEQCVIIGDTPKDLEAARHNGMKCVLVGTGRYPVEELLYWQPDACLADLTDTAAVLAALARI